MKRWRNGYRGTAIRYGGGRVGQRVGRREGRKSESGIRKRS